MQDALFNLPPRLPHNCPDCVSTVGWRQLRLATIETSEGLRCAVHAAARNSRQPDARIDRCGSCGSWLSLLTGSCGACGTVL